MWLVNESSAVWALDKPLPAAAAFEGSRLGAVDSGHRHSTHRDDYNRQCKNMSK